MEQEMKSNVIYFVIYVWRIFRNDRNESAGLFRKCFQRRRKTREKTTYRIKLLDKHNILC